MIKPKNDGSIINIETFTPTRVQKKLIKIVHNKVMMSDHKNNFNGTYHTQKYDLTYVLTKIVCFIHEHHKWRNLGRGYQNIYKRFIQLEKMGILSESFKDMLSKYADKRNGRHLKVVSTDTTFILNKYGTDCIKRNRLVKNKNCTKLLLIVDDKGIPITTHFFSGNMYDSKCLINILDDFLERNPDITTFLADAGFYTSEIINVLLKHNIKPIIAKNVRNKGKKNKKIKLSYKEKINRQTEDFTKKDKKLYRKRIKSENVFANYKQIPHFVVRYDRLIKNLYGLSLIYFLEQILKHM